MAPVNRDLTCALDYYDILPSDEITVKTTNAICTELQSMGHATRGEANVWMMRDRAVILIGIARPKRIAGKAPLSDRFIM